jgi:phosphatidylglycerol:prolipoprotein diacylglycerol transferase
LVGAAASTWLFCRIHDKDFLRIADELAVPGAWVMGVGRIGNFIDGQIMGAVTESWWGVKFPDAPGFRDPVVLYDGVKNLLLIPLLLLIRRARPVRGVVFANFLFWYAFLRLFVDLFREYRVSLVEIGTGQVINISMALAGLILMVWFSRRGRHLPKPIASSAEVVLTRGGLWRRRALLVSLLSSCLIMPSDWTQDIPTRYGKRHQGLHYSKLYPRIATEPLAPQLQGLSGSPVDNPTGQTRE